MARPHQGSQYAPSLNEGGVLGQWPEVWAKCFLPLGPKGYGVTVFVPLTSAKGSHLGLEAVMSRDVLPLSLKLKHRYASQVQSEGTRK